MKLALWNFGLILYKAYWVSIIQCYEFVGQDSADHRWRWDFFIYPFFIKHLKICYFFNHLSAESNLTDTLADWGVRGRQRNGISIVTNCLSITRNRMWVYWRLDLLPTFLDISYSPQKLHFHSRDVLENKCGVKDVIRVIEPPTGDTRGWPHTVNTAFITILLLL